MWPRYYATVSREERYHQHSTSSLFMDEDLRLFLNLHHQDPKYVGFHAHQALHRLISVICASFKKAEGNQSVKLAEVMIG